MNRTSNYKLCSFRAWGATPKETTAIQWAKERNCLYAFCPLDGKFYCGTREELGTGPFIDFTNPNDIQGEPHNGLAVPNPQQPRTP